MIKMLMDDSWRKRDPAGYSRYLAVYGVELRAIWAWYLKHIRRYGVTQLNVLDGNGDVIKKCVFELVDKKNREGTTVVNGVLEFPSIYVAWEYYMEEITMGLMNNDS